ncbi:MAG: hypothetical protein ABIU58_06015 [Ramlibacter sp.]
MGLVEGRDEPVWAQQANPFYCDDDFPTWRLPLSRCPIYNSVRNSTGFSARASDENAAAWWASSGEQYRMHVMRATIDLDSNQPRVGAYSVRCVKN